jgi:predicted O-linked N-acetylglucosamine transferase (SPINDLY family)
MNDARRAALQQALAHHQAGRFKEAEALYDAILAEQPDEMNAIYLGGVLLHQTGRHEAAIARIERAIAAKPEMPAFHNNLGEALRALGRQREAQTAYDRALALDANFLEAIVNRAVLAGQRGEYERAEAELRRALALAPGRAEIHNNLAVVLRARDDRAAAEAQWRTAIDLKPDYLDALLNLGASHLARLDGGALAIFERAQELAPDSIDAAVGLARTYRLLDRTDRAEEILKQALERKPDSTYALAEYAGLMMRLDRLGEAAAILERTADSIRADDPAGAMALEQQRLMGMLYLSEVDAATMRAEYARWNERYAAPLARQRRSHGNDRDPARRLRLGYVSGDFKEQVVSLYYFRGVMRAHDRRQFEVTLYANLARADAITRQLQLRADRWRDIRNLTSEAQANLIREDAIDVLVDLSGHSADNCLTAFAYRPAPVQVSWLGYPGTTGVAAIDWRISDAICDPPEEDALSAERVWRLPGFHCFAPLRAAPSVAALPSADRRPFTFASFNNLMKVSNAAAGLFASALAAVPGSRLLLRGGLKTDDSTRARITARIAAHGVDATRVSVLQTTAEPEDALATYGEIDLALDTFPYSGTTTTLDALWMGVPVVTLAGDRHSARVSASLMSQIGLPEFVARTPDEFVAIAAAWATRKTELAALRASLRARLQESRLLDFQRFTRELEDAYRGMWREWVARGG